MKFKLLLVFILSIVDYASLIPLAVALKFRPMIFWNPCK